MFKNLFQWEIYSLVCIKLKTIRTNKVETSLIYTFSIILFRNKIYAWLFYRSKGIQSFGNNRTIFSISAVNCWRVWKQSFAMSPWSIMEVIQTFKLMNPFCQSNTRRVVLDCFYFPDSSHFFPLLDSEFTSM